MPGSGTGTFIDPDDYRASLSQVRIDLLAISQGALKAKLTWATLHHLQLLHSEEDLPRIAYVSLAPGLVFVGFATRPDPPMFWGGVELQTGDIIFHGQGERFHQRTTGPCGWSLLAQLRRFKHFQGSKYLRLLRWTAKGRHYNGVGGTGAAVIFGGGWAGRSSFSFSNRLSSGTGSV